LSELEQLLLKEWFAPEALKDRVLYHYTSAPGLLGILESNSLRGTSAAFLNDTSEIAYGVTVCKETLERECSGSSAIDRALLDHVARELDAGVPPEIFVTSFSSTDDVLGQWRGYGSAAGRYSIGFQMARFSERDALRFPQEVDYDAESQRSRVRHAINLTRDHLASTGDDRRAIFDAVVTLSLYLRRLACVFKHPGFRSEHEWRSVSTLDEHGSVSHVRFEAVDGAPRPYVSMLQGSRETQRLPIVEVRVGSVTRPRATEFATRLLLRRLGYDDVRVTKTEIPLAP
jgi:hypothetical protein